VIVKALGKIPLKYGLGALGSLVLFGLLLTEFNNCGDYAQPATTNGASSLSCTTPNCVISTADNLKIIAHLANGEYDLKADINEFDLGGDCNEGGFLVNKIRWELVPSAGPQAGQVVRNSGMGIAGGSPADTVCVNGRFMVYVYLGPIGEDSVDRTGLAVGGGTRASYNLNITIYGVDPTTGQPFSSIQSKTSVPLNAI
jgi:hypothetical protein